MPSVEGIRKHLELPTEQDGHAVPPGMVPTLVEMQAAHFGITDEMAALANVHSALHHVSTMMAAGGNGVGAPECDQEGCTDPAVTVNPNLCAVHAAELADQEARDANRETHTAKCTLCEWEGTPRFEAEDAAEDTAQHGKTHPGALGVVGVASGRVE